MTEPNRSPDTSTNTWIKWMPAWIRASSAMRTYLAKHMPDLQQIKCVSKAGESDKELSIELVFDRSFEKAQQEQAIQFFKPDDVVSH